MTSGEYNEHAPSHPTVDDLPDDIRDLLESYSGVKTEDVIGHIVNVVCFMSSRVFFSCVSCFSRLFVYCTGREEKAVVVWVTECQTLDVCVCA